MELVVIVSPLLSKLVKIEPSSQSGKIMFLKELSTQLLILMMLLIVITLFTLLLEETNIFYISTMNMLLLGLIMKLLIQMEKSVCSLLKPLKLVSLTFTLLKPVL